jgi:hypothetical protein
MYYWTVSHIALYKSALFSIESSLNKVLFKSHVQIILHVVQSGSGVHSTSYPMGTGGKAAGALGWPLTSS